MPSTARHTRAAAVAAAAVAGAVLLPAAPASAATGATTTTHRLGPVRAAAAASADASLPGYLLRTYDARRGSVLSATTWDRTHRREATVDGDPASTDRVGSVVTADGSYLQDPVLQGKALRLLKRPAGSWVFTAGSSFLRDDRPADRAADLVRDLSPAASVRTAVHTVTSAGDWYTYVDTFRGERSRITVLVVRGRIAFAQVRSAQPPADGEPAPADLVVRLRYGARHVPLPGPVVDEPAFKAAKAKVSGP